jgi:hypothetical protein
MGDALLLRALCSKSPESSIGRIVVAAMRSKSALLVGVMVLSFIGGPGAPQCSGCCPTPDGAGPALSSLACCGEGCAERLAAGQERPCLTSARAAAAKSPVLPVAIAVLHAGSQIFIEPSVQQPLWLPASARSGTNPLRL